MRLLLRRLTRRARNGATGKLVWQIFRPLNPTFEPDPDAFDFVDHPWYRDYFKHGPVGLKLKEYERLKEESEG